jgi:dihydropteroate synthase
MSKASPPPYRHLTRIGKVELARRSFAKVMGVINVSPESFFKGSVMTTGEDVARAAKQMENDGAHIVDIGAMSTAPYLDTFITAEEETSRLTSAITAAKDSCTLAVSADTPRAKVAQAAIDAGADVINDVTGLKFDRNMARVIAKAGAKVIVCAYSRSPVGSRVSETVSALKESMKIARKAGIAENNIIVDPSIGFFRKKGKNPFFTKMEDVPWYVRDIEAIARLDRLEQLRKPICISVSRKSFIGHLLNLESPEDRLVPSIACELLSVMHGANLVRTHNVRETVEALTILGIVGSNSKRL